MKQAPAEGLFNDFRDIAFFHTLGAERGLQGRSRRVRGLLFRGGFGAGLRRLTPSACSSMSSRSFFSGSVTIRVNLSGRSATRACTLASHSSDGAAG